MITKSENDVTELKIHTKKEKIKNILTGIVPKKTNIFSILMLLLVKPQVKLWRPAL
jgi:hypothetical protein